MGEEKRKRSATQKFIAEFPDCYFCGGARRSTTREHMPPKSLFDNSHRPDKLIMPACDTCNRTTSTADLTVAIISRWSTDTSSQNVSDHRKLVAQMRRQAPELVQEWISSDRFGVENARRHLREQGITVPANASVGMVGPHTIRQLNIFAHKATLALYFEHFRKPLPAVGRICAYWRSKEDFFLKGIPPELLEMLPVYARLVQGKWDTHEIFEYRYNFNEKKGLFAGIARFRGGIFVIGFAVPSVTDIDIDIDDWIKPDDPSVLLTLPRYQKKT